jgi:accessory colonization factor AcfC
LGFKKGLELYGFWLGFTIALVFLDTIVGAIVIWSDWSAKSLSDVNTDVTIERSLKITRQNSMFAMSPLLP